MKHPINANSNSRKQSSRPSNHCTSSTQKRQCKSTRSSSGNTALPSSPPHTNHPPFSPSCSDQPGHQHHYHPHHKLPSRPAPQLKPRRSSTRFARRRGEKPRRIRRIDRLHPVTSRSRRCRRSGRGAREGEDSPLHFATRVRLRAREIRRPCGVALCEPGAEGRIFCACGCRCRGELACDEGRAVSPGRRIKSAALSRFKTVYHQTLVEKRRKNSLQSVLYGTGVFECVRSLCECERQRA